METAPGARKRQESRPVPQEDVVELSSSLAGISTQELDREQARHVATLKALVEKGSYRVDATAVAKKMLSTNSGV